MNCFQRPLRSILYGLTAINAAASSFPAGYSIPIVDVANETQRQVVVDREPGQYLGHPTTLLLEDGKTILITYPKGHGRGGLVYKRSSDGGLTWSDRLPVPSTWTTSKEVPTLFRTIDDKGKRRLLLFSGTGARNRELTVRMSVSEDDGASWSELSSIGNFGGIVAMSSMLRLHDGRYMALFHDDAQYWDLPQAPLGQQSRVLKTMSSDGGLTWSHPEEIARHPTAFLCEPGALRSPDGRQIAVLLRENSRKLNSFVVFSNDEGSTWSEPQELPAALTGDRHVAKYTPDGRLFISFRDTTRESATKGDWVAWVGTYQDIVKGVEGAYRVRLMHNTKGVDCAYPSIELLPDHTLVATTYGHWVEGESPYIVSVRFKTEELDAKAATLSRNRN